MTHADVSAQRERLLVVVVCLNMLIVAGEVVGGVGAHSIGLLADAGHNLTDVGGVALSVLAVRWARRSPDAARSFGYHRGTVLTAQANAAAILAATALIAYEGVRRLMHPHPVHGLVVVVVAAVALVANGGAAWLLRGHNQDLNMRAALLHMAADAVASLGVIVSGAVIAATGRFDRLDPAVSLAIGALIAWQAWRLLRATSDVLLEGTPRGIDVTEVAAAIVAVPGVEAVHDLHVWSLSSEVRALSAHVIVEGHPSLEEAQEVGTRVKAALSGPFRIAHATIELECEGCVDDESWCAMHAVDLTADTHAGHPH